MPEHVLIAWLCIWRNQIEKDEKPLFYLPHKIGLAWQENGWIDIEENEDGKYFSITEKGLAVTDLNAAEWGIDSIPKEDS